jgi:diguanylate cyclase (GGDEF)-like protein
MLAATETLAVEARLQLYQQALDKIRQGLCVFDSEQRLLLFNRRYAEMYGLLPQDLWLGMTLRDVVDLRCGAGTGPDMTKEAYSAWRDRIQVSDRVLDTVVELRNGTVHEIHHEPTPDGGWVATFDDITERRRFEARIRHMAHHDPLTGLANRLLFRERLEQMVQSVQVSGELGALLFLDLDRFKKVNDTLGHAAGDALLTGVAQRLNELMRTHDTVARLGGDEFAVVLARVERRECAIKLADRVKAEIAKPFLIEGAEIRVGVSIGIAMSSDAGETLSPAWMLRSADSALYLAKADPSRTC